MVCSDVKKGDFLILLYNKMKVGCVEFLQLHICIYMQLRIVSHSFLPFVYKLEMLTSAASFSFIVRRNVDIVPAEFSLKNALLANNICYYSHEHFVF